VMALVVKLLEVVKASSTSNNCDGVFEVKIKANGEVRSKKKVCMELVIPRKSKEALSKRSRSAQDKAGVTLAVLKQLCGEPNEELMKEVIVLLAQKLSCAAIQWEDFFLTVDECIKTELGILPTAFAEFYNFYKRDLAPDAWIEGIEKAESLGSKAKAEMRYF
jgi:hypothetical protein